MLLGQQMEIMSVKTQTAILLVKMMGQALSGTK